MTYDEAVTAWAIKKYGDKTVAYYWNSNINKGKLKDIIDTQYPVEIIFNYQEGYNYSEYTNADSSFEIFLSYVPLDTNGHRTTFEIYSNEIVPLAQMTREILETSLSSNSSQEVFY